MSLFNPLFNILRLLPIALGDLRSLHTFTMQWQIPSTPCCPRKSHPPMSADCFRVFSSWSISQFSFALASRAIFSLYTLQFIISARFCNGLTLIVSKVLKFIPSYVPLFNFQFSFFQSQLLRWRSIGSSCFFLTSLILFPSL